jgi:DNA-binding transcriptional MerR regulator
MTLAELSEASGVPARTLRFYIARGLLQGPAKAGRGATYTEEHLLRVEQIKKWQAGGRMLSEIGRELAEAPEPVKPVPWKHYAIAEDVIVQVRSGASPWRTKQIRNALEELVRRLGPEGNEHHE